MKCDKCANTRTVLSENGWHYTCCLSSRAQTNCILGKKDRFVERKSKATIGS